MAKPKARIAEGRAAQPTPAAATVASAFAQARPRESHPRGSDRPRPRHPNFSPQLKISGFAQTRRSERCSRDALRHAGRGRRVIHRPILPAQAPESAKIGSWAVRGRSRRAGKRCVSVFSAVTAASAGAAASLRPTVDHVVARVLGGGHELDNLRPCCARCNYSSGASLGNRLRGMTSAPTWRSSRRW